MANLLVKNYGAQITAQVKAIFSEYQKNPKTILTESDLHCLTYKKLLDIGGINSQILHSEVSWYDANDELVWRPDLSIIAGEIGRENSGKFEFSGEGAVLFEFKIGRGGYENLYGEITKDFDKFKQLCKINENLFCFFVVLVTDNNPSQNLRELAHKMGENFKFLVNI